MKLYGSVDNRFDENKNFLNRDIQIGDDITFYLWSDRICYYVTNVIDQKHIFVRKYEVVADREKECRMGHQNWLYFKTVKECNDYLRKYGLGTDEPVFEHIDEEWVYRYNHWYRAYNNYSGKRCYEKINISFGVRDYYFDWEF